MHARSARQPDQPEPATADHPPRQSILFDRQNASSFIK